MSVSATTRPPRPGEVDGRDYRFVSEEGFDRLVEQDAFLEWAEVFGRRYGTLAGPVLEGVHAGKDVLLEIDIQGARTVRRKVPDAVLIFLVAPSEEELARRLLGRHTESGPELARRLGAAREELAQAMWFDHVVVSDDVDRVAHRVAAIIEASRTTG